MKTMQTIGLAALTLWAAVDFALGAVPELHPGRVLVRFKETAGAAAQAPALRREMGARTLRRYDRLGGVEVLELPKGGSVAATIRQLKASGAVVFAEPDYVVRAIGNPNDPRFTDGSLWGLRNTGQSAGITDADIDAPEGWDARNSAQDIIVAVIDTGIRYTHEDLALNVWRNPDEIAGNGVDDDGNGIIDDVHGFNAITGSGNPADDHGHGTHCAGTIGAVGNNGKGVAGVAWRVQLMTCKFLDSSGSGFISDALECIDYAIEKGAHVMSNSWGGGGFSQSMSDAITAARSAGILFVAAAGNSTSDNDAAPAYPASYPQDNVVSVASSTRLDALSSFSNFGATTVDLAGPGSEIVSTFNTSDTAYTTLSGTSMATPHVAGALALLRAHHTGDLYIQLIQRLLNGADRLPAFAGKCVSGGRLNLAGALGASSRPGNDDFAGAGALSKSRFVVSGSNLDATREPGEPNHAGDPGGASVWWKWTAPVAGPTMITTAGSSFNTVLAVYTGSSVGSLTLVASNDDADGLPASRVTFTAILGVTYRIAVDGVGGAMGTVTLTGQGPSVVANDDFANRRALTGAQFVTAGTNVEATKEAGEPNHAGNAGAASVWWKWTAPGAGNATIRTAGSGFDTLLAVYTGDSVGALTEVASNDDASSDLRSEVVFRTVAGATYQIAVDGFNGATGAIVLRGDWVAIRSNDDFANRRAIAGTQFVTSGTSVGATREPGEPFHAGSAGGASVWWSWIAPATGDATILTSGSGFDTLLAVYTGDSLGGLAEVASNDDLGAGVTSGVAFPTVAGTAYQIAVDGYESATGGIVLSGEVFFIPDNDDFADRRDLGNRNFLDSGPNRRASRETDEPAESGENTVWWTWTPAASGTVVITTAASDFDSVLSVFTGAGLDALQLLADDDDGGPGRTSRVSFQAQAQTTYQIAIGGVSSTDAGQITLRGTINPFTRVLGSYRGLVFSDTAPDGPSGSLSLRITSQGRFTGSLFYDGRSHRFSGTFNELGEAALRISRGRVLPPLDLSLRLDVAGRTETLTGAVAEGAAIADLLAHRAAYGSGKVAPQAGKYTALFLAPQNPPDGVPPGIGYGTVTVSKSGTGRLVGKLGDATAFSQGVHISREGLWPFFADLYSKRGAARGFLQFEDRPDESDLHGALRWRKPLGVKGGFFSAGFATDLTAIGSRYTPPAAGTPMLDFAARPQNAMLTFGPADLLAPRQPVTVTLLATNRILVPSTERLSMTLSPASGGFSGAFRDTTNRSRTFRGVVFQKQNLGAGLFLGDKETDAAHFEAFP